MCTSNAGASRHDVKITYRYPWIKTHFESWLSDLEEDTVLKPHSTLVFATMVLMVLLQVRLGYALAPVPVVPAGFVELRGPHGVTVLVGPLVSSPSGGYEREVILPGQPPFMVSTEPGVTPQDIANTYG